MLPSNRVSVKRRGVKPNKVSNPLLLPFEQSTSTRNESWDRVGHGGYTDPSFKSGEKKDAFVGTLEIGQHSSPHPGRYWPTNASIKGCSPKFGHSNSE
ncbi:hypothetical protein CHARACLAT_025911 [Characodon lateralis]|uniref:Uncharacterized protein n=1 Tax=Characodon lateralis TaxID=208331 RepID=A0ABU7ECX7_9TELE|nr:hypothetical protein [Characodon lateralis]